MTTTAATAHSATLGERCLAWCLAQAEREPVPTPDTLARWFAPCVRDGEPLGIRSGNHCAAAQCAAALACADGETLPHQYRAAAKEIMADAIDAGAWHEASELRAGLWYPAPGDLAVYDRSQPGRPETAWWGHVDRVISVLSSGFGNVGANEGPGGAWRIQVTDYSHARLLGFVAYPRPHEQRPVHLLSREEVARIRNLVALTAHTAAGPEASWWET